MRGLFLVCLVALGETIGFSQEARVFGQSNSRILKMGHDRWIRWSCDSSRAGEAGRRDAEVTFCLAVHERNVTLLAQKSVADQRRYDDYRALFADMAKSAFVAGSELYRDWNGWPVAIAESSTAVNVAIFDLLSGRASAVVPTESEVLLHWRNGLAAALALPEGHVGREAYNHMSGHIHTVATKFEGRPKREFNTAMSFCDAMVELASKHC